MIDLTSLRLIYSIRFLDTSQLGTRVCESLLYNQLEFDLFYRSKRILICSFSESGLGFSLLHELSELSSTGLPVLT